MPKGICLLLIVGALATTLCAQKPALTPTGAVDATDVFGPKLWYFPFDRSNLMHDYADNAHMFEALDSLLSIPRISTKIDSVWVTAAASPTGAEAHNHRLARARAEAMIEHLRHTYPYIPASRIAIQWVGIDYDGAAAIYEREQEQIANLKSLEERDAWLMRNVYPRLQYVSVKLLLNNGTLINPERGSPIRAMLNRETANYDSISTQLQVPISQPVRRDTVYIIQRDTIHKGGDTYIFNIIGGGMPGLSGNDAYEEPEESKPLSSGKPRQPRLRIKTNLLYDLALLPNLALEYSITRRWSMAIEGYWSWWSIGAPKYWYHRIQMAGIESKFWLGSRPLRQLMSGHYVGIYGMAGNYDLRLFTNDLDDFGYQSRRSYSAGLTYGFSHYLGRHWALEYSLGAGYFGGVYDEYNISRCTDCPALRTTKKMRYFGPTRAAVSLIFQL
jgi:hypothetical protein